MDHNKNENLPENRRRKLKDILNKNELVRVIEVHNGISSLIAEKSFAFRDGEKKHLMLYGLVV